MHSLLEWYYLLALPVTLVAGVMARLKKAMRLSLYVLAIVLLGGWYLAKNRLAARAERVEKGADWDPRTLVEALGQPDFRRAYPEGDEDWVYVVRVWPWRTGRVLNVYGNRVLAHGRLAEVDLFFRPTFRVLNEKESQQVKEFLRKTQDAPERAR